MRINKFTAAAVLAIGATGVTAGTAYAAPAVVPPVSSAHAAVAPASVLSGSQKGVFYESVLAADGSALVTSLKAGTFALAADKVVTISNAAGHEIGKVPTRLNVDGRTLTVRPVIDRSGTRLTLTPVAARATRLKDINSQQWFFYELQRAALGGVVGAIIGGLLGLLVIVGVIPGAIIGAVIGLLVAGGPPLINAGEAYFSGQP